MIKWLSSILRRDRRTAARPDVTASSLPPARTPYRGGPSAGPAPIRRFDLPEFSAGTLAAPEAGLFFVHDLEHRLSGYDFEGNELGRSFPLVDADGQALEAAPGVGHLLLALSPSGVLLARASSKTLDIVDANGRVVWGTEVEPTWGEFEALAFDRSGSTLWLVTERPDGSATAVFAFDPEVGESPLGTFEIRGARRNSLYTYLLSHWDEDRAVMVVQARQDDDREPHCVLVGLRAEPSRIQTAWQSSRRVESVPPVWYGSAGFLVLDVDRGKLTRRAPDGALAAESQGRGPELVGWDGNASRSMAAFVDPENEGIVSLYDTFTLALLSQHRMDSDGRAPTVVFPLDERRTLARYGHRGMNPFTKEIPGHWTVLWNVE